MDFLTTITYSNDASDAFEKNPERMAEILSDAITGAGNHHNGRSYSEPVAGYCNYVKVQQIRHADDSTMYLHMGNTVIEMNPYSFDTKNLLDTNPEFFKRAVAYMEDQVKAMKQMQKDKIKNSYNNSEKGLEELRVKLRSMPSESFDNPTAKVAKLKEIRAWTGMNLQGAVDFLASM